MATTPIFWICCLNLNHAQCRQERPLNDGNHREPGRNEREFSSNMFLGLLQGYSHHCTFSLATLFYVIWILVLISMKNQLHWDCLMNHCESVPFYFSFFSLRRKNTNQKAVRIHCYWVMSCFLVLLISVGWLVHFFNVVIVANGGIQRQGRRAKLRSSF